MLFRSDDCWFIATLRVDFDITLRDLERELDFPIKRDCVMLQRKLGAGGVSDTLSSVKRLIFRGKS